MDTSSICWTVLMDADERKIIIKATVMIRKVLTKLSTSAIKPAHCAAPETLNINIKACRVKRHKFICRPLCRS